MGTHLTTSPVSPTPSALLAATLESCHDAVVCTTAEGIITRWNAAAERLFGYRPVEAIGQHISLTVPPERAHEVREILEHVTRGERTEFGETERVRKDGSRVSVSLVVAPVAEDTGTAVAAVATAIDISDRLGLEAERAAHEWLAGALLVAGTAVREIKSGLAPITGFAELLAVQLETDHDPTLAAYAANVRDAAQAIAVKLSRLQRITHLDEEMFPTTTEPLLAPHPPRRGRLGSPPRPTPQARPPAGLEPARREGAGSDIREGLIVRVAGTNEVVRVLARRARGWVCDDGRVYPNRALEPATEEEMKAHQRRAERAEARLRELRNWMGS